MEGIDNNTDYGVAAENHEGIPSLTADETIVTVSHVWEVIEPVLILTPAGIALTVSPRGSL